MSWTWVQDLLAPDNKKKAYYDAHCPYKLTCPSHQPHEHAHKPKLKFIQKLSFFVYQYKCKYCGCSVNISVSQPYDGNRLLKDTNPVLFGGKPNFKFYV